MRESVDVSYQPLIYPVRDPPPSPDLEPVRTLFDRAFPPSHSPDPKHDPKVVAIVGSIAGQLTAEGEFPPADPRRDIDFWTLDGNGSMGEPTTNAFATIDREGIIQPVEILQSTQTSLQTEMDSPHRMYVLNRLVQPGWALQGEAEYEELKTLAHVLVFQRGFTGQRDNGEIHMTPSGFARSVLETVIFVDPKRVKSLNRALVMSREKERERQMLWWYAHQALEYLVNEGIAHKKQRAYAREPGYTLDETAVPKLSALDGVRMRWSFLTDEAKILSPSGTISARQWAGIGKKIGRQVLYYLDTPAPSTNVIFRPSMV